MRRRRSRARRGGRVAGREARGPAPRRPAAGRAGPDGDRRARVGGGRAPVRPALARDDRAAHDGRGRAGPLAPGTARREMVGARRADRHGRGVGRPGATRPPAATTCCCRAWCRARRTPRSPASSGSTSRPSSGGSASCSRRSARRRARTPPRSRSGSGSCEARVTDDAPAARGPAPLRRRRDVHHDRAHRVRLVQGRLREGRRGGCGERRRRGAARGRARLSDRRDHDRGRRGAAAVAAPRQGRRRAASRRRSCSPTSRARRTWSRRSATRSGRASCGGTTRRCGRSFAEHKGEEVVSTGDGFFVGFDSPGRGARVRRRDPAPAGRAPALGGLRAEGADRPARVGRDAGRAGTSRARACTRPSRIAALADGDQIVASRATAADGRFPISEPRTVTLRGTSEPIEIVTVDWG